MTPDGRKTDAPTLTQLREASPEPDYRTIWAERAEMEELPWEPND